MAHKETNIVHAIQLDATKLGDRLFKNVRGGMYPVAAVKPLLTAVLKGQWLQAKKLSQSCHMLLAGLLAPGSSDLIGWTRVVVTEDMVGQTVAVFTAVEVKADTKPSDEQLKFIDIVRNAGGYAGVAWSVEDAKKIMKKAVDEVK